MAEDTPQTGGTVLESHFGDQALARYYGDVTQQVFGVPSGGAGAGSWLEGAGISSNVLPQITSQMIADLTRGNISAADRTTLQSFLLGQVGTQGYMDLFPEMFTIGGFGGGGMSREQMEITSLAAMSRQLRGIGGTFARWLIDSRIKELEYKVAKDLVSRGARQEVSPLKLREAPIPDWMRPYIEEGAPYTSGMDETAGRGRKARVQKETSLPAGTGKLRPISAQEQLTPEQMQMMAAYGAWGQMGFPTSIRNMNKQALLEGLMNTTGWDTYTQLSQKLFPSQKKLGSGWAISQQR